MILRYGEKMWLEQKKSSLFSRMQATLESSQSALLHFKTWCLPSSHSVWDLTQLRIQFSSNGGNKKTLFAVQIWGELLRSAGGLIKNHGLVYCIPLNGYLGSQSVKKTCWEKKILAGSLIWKMLSNICFPKLQREAN